MATDQWAKVQILFEQAVELSPNEREAFLDSNCQDDPELMAEVESLLECDQLASDNFMTPAPPNSIAGTTFKAQQANALVGTEVGHYEIQGVIATGGMGTVYEAKQREPVRLVALKVMHQCIGVSRGLRRFQFESQVLARLQHRNIAQVFEAGMHQSDHGAVPYFAMEYVCGAKPITRYAEDNQLTTHERLRLFVAVCDAVHHGHQKGVIHRDLKPENILVDELGEPKVIDFGVARSTDADITLTTMHTEVGQLIGTLQYMSPEQCAADPLDIDTRCDVYALGAVLHELLTGRLPYNVSNLTLQAAARIICEQPPERPSRFVRSLAGDLDAIVLKSMAKRRDDRYESVCELARDIRAFMRGEPISARPPTVWQRMASWAMRHPKAAAMVSSLLIAAGIMGGSCAVIAKRMHDLSAQPLRIDFDDRRGNEAALIARDGRTIRRWESSRERSLRFAVLIHSAQGNQNSAYAVVGGLQAERLEYPSGVNVYEVDGGRTRFSWGDSVGTEDLPDSLRRVGDLDVAVGALFHPQICWHYDVFRSRPGDELVVSFSSDSSLRMLVIYDTKTGERLYRVWHDGAIHSTCFLAKPGLLLLATEDARTYLKDMGYDSDVLSPPGIDRPARYPTLLVALKIERGEGVEKPLFIALDEGLAGIQPMWLRWFLPLWAQDVVCLRFVPKLPVPAPRAMVHCVVDYLGSKVDRNGIGANFAFNLSEDGHEVPLSRESGDTYEHYRDGAPEHTLFQLCDRIPLPGEDVPPGECPQ